MKNKKIYVPIWEKVTITVSEASEYSGIGVNKLRELTNDENCTFVLWVGRKCLIKRKQFDDFIKKMYSI